MKEEPEGDREVFLSNLAALLMIVFVGVCIWFAGGEFLETMLRTLNPFSPGDQFFYVLLLWVTLAGMSWIYYLGFRWLLRRFIRRSPA